MVVHNCTKSFVLVFYGKLFGYLFFMNDFILHSQMHAHLRNKFNFWSVHGIMNTSGLVQSK